MVPRIVCVAPLVKGDGIDVVIALPSGRSRTVQLSCVEARELSKAICGAVAKSEAELSDAATKVM